MPWPLIAAAAASAAGNMAGSLGSQSGGYDLIPPALGGKARKQFGFPLAQSMFNISQGGGGFGPNYEGQAFQQARSMMAPAMRDAQQSLGFSQMQRGIFDSGVAQQQNMGLQNAFLSSLGRNALDISLKAEVQRRAEAMQAMQMLMGGLSYGGAMQTPASMNTTGVVGQGVLGGAGDAMSMYAMMKMMQPQAPAPAVNRWDYSS